MRKTITIKNAEEIVTYELASFGPRLAARILDSVIIFIPNSIIPIIPAWLYWSLQQSGNDQATVGQKAFKIKVIDINGGKVGFGQATGRFFGNFLNILTFFIGYFMFFFTDKNQCLHDLVANCVVVNEVEIERVGDDISRHLVESE